MFKPHFEALPSPQKKLWNELAEAPKQFVLYGGTALGLRLGHRQSVDFDFFSSEVVAPEDLLGQLGMLRGARILQSAGQSLTVVVERGGPVKVSFFGGITMGRVGTPERTSDEILTVASLLDLAGTEVNTVLQPAEAKDYLDLRAIFKSGISLAQAMAAARALYGDAYNPMLTVKALTYFGDGDLHKLSELEKEELTQIASGQRFDLPPMPKLSNELGCGEFGKSI